MEQFKYKCMTQGIGGLEPGGKGSEMGSVLEEGKQKPNTRMDASLTLDFRETDSNIPSARKLPSEIMTHVTCQIPLSLSELPDCLQTMAVMTVSNNLSHRQK